MSQSSMPQGVEGLSSTNPEVRTMATRRRFTQEYKRHILAEAEACKERGELGALLRREGLYSSHLAKWREQAASGELGGRKRGRKPDPDRSLRLKLEQLERENVRLRKKLRDAETIISFQKKVARLLEADESESE